MIKNDTSSCHQIGVCRRTTDQCQKACHMASGEPPIGYEAAYTGDENQDHGDAVADQILFWLVLLVVLVFGILYGIITPDSFLHLLGRAAMSL